MAEKTAHANGQQNEMTIEQAAALHLATIRHDRIGESVGRIFYEVKALVPKAAEPDLIKTLRDFAGKGFIRIKPDGFVQVFHGGLEYFDSVASSALSSA